MCITNIDSIVPPAAHDHGSASACLTIAARRAVHSARRPVRPSTRLTNAPQSCCQTISRARSGKGGKAEIYLAALRLERAVRAAPDAAVPRERRLDVARAERALERGALRRARARVGYQRVHAREALCAT